VNGGAQAQALGRPLRVLHVTESLAHGGAEQNLLSFLRRLPPERFQHHLAYLYPDETLVEKFRPHVASFVPLGAGRGPGLIKAALALRGWMRRHPIDVVHTQLLRAQLVARTAAWTAALGRVPVVTTWQNAFYDDCSVADFGSPARRELVRRLDGVTGRYDRHFIAVSEHVAAHCSERLGVPRDKVSVIYNCVEPTRYAPVPEEVLGRTRAELGLAPETRIILSVGRLVVQKGQRHLIAAMPYILRHVPHAVLLIAGGGPLRAELQAQATALALGDRVRLLGARGDVPALYQMADLFAFPSLYEGLSVALVEALANALPAVVSDIPQNREVIERTGQGNGQMDGQELRSVRRVPREDAGELGRAVVELLLAGETVRKEALVVQDAVRLRFSPETLAHRFGETLARVVA
jgi:glycosyltransferase involved in cell wall biosynthesis